VDQKKLEEIRARHQEAAEGEGQEQIGRAHADRGWRLDAIAEAQAAERKACALRVVTSDTPMIADSPGGVRTVLEPTRTFAPTVEEVASCAVLAEVAGKTERDAAIELAAKLSAMTESRNEHAARVVATGKERDAASQVLTQARSLLQRARPKLETLGRHLSPAASEACADLNALRGEVAAFLAGLPVTSGEAAGRSWLDAASESFGRVRDPLPVLDMRDKGPGTVTSGEGDR
jgi:hypothetical protein